MDFLEDHGDKLLVVAVVALCAAALWYNHESPKTISDQVDGYKDKINAALAKAPTENYLPGPPDYLDHAKQIVSASSDPLKDPIRDHVSYPRPARPEVNQDENPVKQGLAGRTDVDASPGTMSDLKATADNGVIFISFKPTDTQYMDLVRLEIFRSETEKIDTTKEPYDKLELGPEEPPAAAAAGKAEDKAAPAEESSGSQRRRLLGGAGEQPAEGAPKPMIPKELAGLVVYRDSRVEPKKTYYYQVRLVGRMTKEDGESVPTGKKSPAGVDLTQVVHAPKDLQPVTPELPASTVKLYASAFSPVLSATAPAEYEFRFAGTVGNIPEEGETPPQHPDYKGRFAIRVWLVDAQLWQDAEVLAGVDEKIKGKVNYTMPETKERRSKEFDTGYKLVEIKTTTVTDMVPHEEPVLDDKGNPVIENGQPKMHTVQKPVVKPGQLVAILEEIATGKQVPYPKTSDFKKRAQFYDYLDFLAKQAADEAKKKKTAQPKPQPKRP